MQIKNKLSTIFLQIKLALKKKIPYGQDSADILMYY